MSQLESKSFWEKIKKDPVPAIGMAGFFGVIGYSLYNYRNKSASTKPSVYVIQTRVAAQGLVIGILTVSLGFHMYQNYLHRNDPHENALNLHHHHDQNKETNSKN